jgi:hypothetical protein
VPIDGTALVHPAHLTDESRVFVGATSYDQHQTDLLGDVRADVRGLLTHRRRVGRSSALHDYTRTSTFTRKAQSDRETPGYDTTRSLLRIVPAHARRRIDVMDKMRIALGCVAMTAPVKITAAAPVIVAPSTEAAVTNCAWTYATSPPHAMMQFRAVHVSSSPLSAVACSTSGPPSPDKRVRGIGI